MQFCYEISFIDPKGHPYSSGEAQDFQTGNFLVLKPEALKKLEKVVFRYGGNVDSWLWHLEQFLRESEMPYPWAIIVFDRDYEIGSYIHQVRGLIPVRFSSFSGWLANRRNYDLNAVGFMLIFNKSDLRELARRAILFQPAWNLMHDKSENSHWISFMDLDSDVPILGNL